MASFATMTKLEFFEYVEKNVKEMRESGKSQNAIDGFVEHVTIQFNYQQDCDNADLKCCEQILRDELEINALTN